MVFLIGLLFNGQNERGRRVSADGSVASKTHQRVSQWVDLLDQLVSPYLKIEFPTFVRVAPINCELHNDMLIFGRWSTCDCINSLNTAPAQRAPCTGCLDGRPSSCSQALSYSPSESLLHLPYSFLDTTW